MKITMNGLKNGSIRFENGRIVKESFPFGGSKVVDETKSIGTFGIKKIRVYTKVADVVISTGTTSKVVVRYHGDIVTEGRANLAVSRFNDEINIVGNFNGNIFSGSLKLEIEIPNKQFEKIKVESINGRVTLKKEVKATSLNIRTTNGSVETEAYFKEANVRTINGSLYIYAMANNDINIYATSANGSIEVKLENISFYNMETSSVNGSVRTRYNLGGKYKATGKVTSLNGSIMMR